MMMSAVGLRNPLEITVLLNQGKNPTISNTIQSTLSSAFLQGGISQYETCSSYDVGGRTTGSLVMIQMMVIRFLRM